MPDGEDAIVSSDSAEGASPAHYLTFVSQRTFPISELQPGNRMLTLLPSSVMIDYYLGV